MRGTVAKRLRKAANIVGRNPQERRELYVKYKKEKYASKAVTKLKVSNRQKRLADANVQAD